MTKAATIASLNRAAARNEEEFVATVQTVLDDNDHERTAEFFDKLNIPRSVPGERTDEPLATFTLKADSIGDYEQERAISNGLQKFLDRHERKIKWHAGHPGMEGVDNICLVLRTGIMATEIRMARLHLLLAAKDELTASEWAIAREIMNRSYLSFRNYLTLLAGPWVEGMMQVVEREELATRLGTFYEIIDGAVRTLEEHRDKLEARRVELTVLPEGFPPVKPPNYFGGDLMGVGPWTQFWANLQGRAHHFRESVG